MNNWFGTLLRGWIDRERLSQTAAAKRLGVSSAQVNRWLIGQQPRAEMIEKILPIISPILHATIVAEDSPPYGLSLEQKHIADLQQQIRSLTLERDDLARRLRAINQLTESDEPRKKTQPS